MDLTEPLRYVVGLVERIVLHELAHAADEPGALPLDAATTIHAGPTPREDTAP